MSETAPGMPEGFSRFTDTLRAAVAGASATKILTSATMLFEAGGKYVLAAETRGLLKAAAERGATKALAAASPLLARTPATMAPALPSAATGAARAVAVSGRAAAIAGREVLRGAGKAAGIGFAIDGAFAGIEALIAHREGKMDASQAARHVAREATTGAIATGAGVLAGATLVAVTGGIAAPVLYAVSAVSAIATKRALRKRP